LRFADFDLPQQTVSGLPLDKSDPARAGMAEPAVMPIVREVLAGNRDAFEEIVFLYRNQVYSAAWQVTRNADDAMDVAQEVFLRVFKALSSYKGNSKFSTWLHRIVLNTSIDYIRKRRRHEQGRAESPDEADEERAEQAPGGVTPETQRETVYFNELQGHVLTALNQISAKQRQVFLLRYYNELSIKEIAAVLRCTEGAVKRHLYRAQSRLKILLKDVRTK
jgi:RNA polymerase sigma-70 factor, ECF subfamily